MNHDGMQKLLCETYKKCRVAAARCTPEQLGDVLIDERLRLLFDIDPGFFPDHFRHMTGQRTIYRYQNPFGISYLLLCLPDPDGQLLVLGPYLREPYETQKILEMSEKFRLPPNRVPVFESILGGIPYIPESSHLFVLLDAFAEQLWQDGFTVTDIGGDPRFDPDRLPDIRQSGTDEVLLRMKMMEERYAAENELIHAVSCGHVHKAAQLMESFGSISFEKRLDDPLRNMKNYSIIMNTLLRKAVEQSGVHPIYLDRMSSSFAVRIEQISSETEIRRLMTDMYRSYCQLVRKHTMKNYSSPVRRVILTIDADLSADLSLGTLAAAQNLSPSYLSSLFRRETGKTLTDYINRERINLSEHLLKTTSLQVQTVALHCGIMDVQYFSKLFKKYTGTAPTDYRELHRGSTGT